MAGVSRTPFLVLGVILSAIVFAAPAAARNDSWPTLARRSAPARPVSAVKGFSGVSSLEAQVAQQVNTVRVRHGLARLRVSGRLSAAADVQSEAMGARGFFSHNSADGSPFWKRIRRFYTDRNYRFWSVGENLLWSSPDVDASQAIDIWMKSPEHRANLLNRRWREIGLSAVHVAHAPGAFQGLDVTIMTADFGYRR
jgi:uncharacterized protein YkwD